MDDGKSNALTKLGPDLATSVLSAKPAEADAPDETIDFENCYLRSLRGKKRLER